ncbi:MAG TPA: DUF4232 domain-containing protein [Pseudonocardiaceae bacterium]|jgi:hypothetical protein|nr:DUF4232 domain-containing protein [Pseudonocardiaceae bacterium]
MNSSTTRRIAVRTLLAASGVLAAVGLAGCNGNFTASGTANDGSATVQATGNDGATTAPAASSASSSTGTGGGGSGSGGSGGSGGAAGSGAPARTAECTAADLKLTFGGGDAGMNQQETVLRFTNASSRKCVVVGFPGVSYVAGDNGQQVGAAANRDGSAGSQVTLAPGAVASTVIHSVDAGVTDNCQPTAVRGYRVYAPDDTASMFIALPSGATACAGPGSAGQLDVHTIKAGTGDPDNP